MSILQRKTRTASVAVLIAAGVLVTVPIAAATGVTAALTSGTGSADKWDVTTPRGKTRVIDFNTTEGTGMSVDISPDGRWLVFDLLAHVYRVSVSGGQAQCLTQSSGIALNYHPRFSPDGRRIAFISDRGGQNNLWIMDSDGQNSRPVSAAADLDTSLAEPVWMPDGKAVVAVRYFPHALGGWTRTNRLWMFPLDGQPARALPTSMDTLVDSPAISPDGQYLYYHSSSMPVIGEGYYKIGTNHELRRLHLTRGVDEVVSQTAARRYYHREPFYAFAPSISPDGRWLAFARRVPGGGTQHHGVTYAQRTGLWLRDLETGSERLLIQSLAPDQLETHTMYQIRLLPGYAWAPDGASIVYSEGGQLRRVHLEDGRVETIPFQARVQRVLSEQVRPSLRIPDGPLPIRFPRWPAVSPNGKAVAFEAVGSIWLQDIPGGRPRRLSDAARGSRLAGNAATGGDAAAKLAPRDESGLPDVPADSGSTTVQLTPAWSRDGRSLAYTSWSDEEGGHVWTVDTATGKSRRLTQQAGEYLNPTWTLDGRDIIVARGSGAALRGEGTARSTWNDLVRLPAAGGAQRLLIRLAPAGEGFVRPSILEDGRIYFMARIAPSEAGADPRAQAALRSMLPDGSDVRTHVTVPSATDVDPSPDGKWLAISAVESVFLAPFPTALPAPTVRAVPLIDRNASGASVQELNPAGGFFPRWSANGTLAFFSGPRLIVHDPNTGSKQTPSRAHAIDLHIDRATPLGTLALTNARILTLEGRKTIDRGTILIRGNRIVALGAVDFAQADKVIDLQGRTVIPGLIDIHAHHYAGSADGEIIPPHRVESANYLAYGVTTTFDPAAPSQVVFPAAELTAAGTLIGPRLFSTGLPLTGSPDLFALQSPAQAQRIANRMVTWGALGLKQYYQPRRAQRQWVSVAARARGDVLVTGEGMDFTYNLSMIMDGQTAWEHPILDIPLYADAIQFLARSRVVYNPELITPGQGLYILEYYMSRSAQTEDPKQQRWVRWDQLMRKKNQTRRPLEEYPVVFSVEGVKDIVRAGGKVGVGGHGQEQGLGTHWEMWTFAKALAPIEALEAATIHNARYLGFDRDLGSIAVGKLADLVILDADPLVRIENSTKIHQVMLDGRLFDAETLDEIWPYPRPYGPRRWTLESALSRSASRGTSRTEGVQMTYDITAP